MVFRAKSPRIAGEQTRPSRFRTPSARTPDAGCWRRPKTAAGQARPWLEELGIEHQLQLARLDPLFLPPLKLQKLLVEYDFQLARFGRAWLVSRRRCSGGGQRAERAFPETAVTQDPRWNTLVLETSIPLPDFVAGFALLIGWRRCGRVALGGRGEWHLTAIRGRG